MTCLFLTVYSESRLELVLLKQDLIHGLLNGREVEVRLSDDDAGVCEVHLNTRQPAEEEEEKEVRLTSTVSSISRRSKTFLMKEGQK